MAITDISISEELMTNAPSIKYRGKEGPKSPQEMEMMMVDALLDEEYEKYIYDLLEQRPDATPMSKDEFRRMIIGEGMMSGGNPLPEDPTKPVNPFAPKPTGPTLPNRQMAAYGGIMGLDGRKQYGIGSYFQELKDKIFDNPVAATAAALYGLDTFGGGSIGNINIPGGDKIINTKIGEIFGSLSTPRKGPVMKRKDGSVITDQDGNPIYEERGSILGDITSGIAKNIVPIVGGIGAGLFTKDQPEQQTGMPSDNTALQLADLKKAANLLTQEQGLASNLNFLPAVAARKFTPEQMALQYAQSAANGGRIGMAEGGLMDLGGLEKDYRAEGGFVPIGKREKADDVPARLSVNEFVFTADAVRNAGGGDVDQGAKVMERVMKHLEGGGQISRESQGMGGAREMFEVSERLSEVV
jgi:uncharacterized short protein YbdD (DUF466 family)